MIEKGAGRRVSLVLLRVVEGGKPPLSLTWVWHFTPVTTSKHNIPVTAVLGSCGQWWLSILPHPYTCLHCESQACLNA